MLRQCIQRARVKGDGGGRRLPNCYHLRQSFLSTLPSFDNDDNNNNNNTNINNYKLSTSTSTSFKVNKCNNNPRSSTVTTKRYLSISRYTDPLTRHGTINKLDDDEDDHDIIGGNSGVGGGSATGLLKTADDLEYEDLFEGDGLGLGLSSRGNAEEDDMTIPLSEFWADEMDEASSSNGGKGGGRGSDDYSNLFGTFGDDNDDDDDEELDEQAKADEAYRKKQEAINAELDKRTGRLWTDDWIITDEEWMTDELYDDIEEWKVNVYTTRKALESVRVYDDGVPTLQSLSELIVPPTLPSHPGHGTPIKYATYRKRQMKKKLQTSIQLAIHDDILKILNMESWDEKQVAVDALYENIVERMRQREDVLCKLPDFDTMVTEGLEKVLTLVQSNLMRDGRRKQRSVIDDDDASAIAADNDEILSSLGNDDDAGEEEGGNDGSSKKKKMMKMEVQDEGKGETNNVEEIIDVMGVNKESPTPIFMDILAAANSLKQQQSTATSTTSSANDDDSNVKPTTPSSSISKFFTESNNDGVPNLLHPLTVHRNDGVGRMVEEWQLAAHKETKRIMIRDPMVNIASKIVNSVHCCDDENVDEERKGAVRIFVSGKRGVGKVSNKNTLYQKHFDSRVTCL